MVRVMASPSSGRGLAEVAPCSLLEQGRSDHQPLDLARALVDLGDLRVAEVPLDRETRSRSRCRRRSGSPRARRGWRRRTRTASPSPPPCRSGAPAVLEPRRAQREQPRGVDLGRHVGELELDRLVLRDRLAERLALLRVARARPRARRARCRAPARRCRCGRRRACDIATLKPPPTSPSSASSRQLARRRGRSGTTCGRGCRACRRAGRSARPGRSSAG